MDFPYQSTCLKLNKANVKLCKIRHYVHETTLRSIYYAIFQSRLSNVCTAWGHRISILQRNSMSIPLPYSQKQKIRNLLILSKCRTVFLLINLCQVLCTIYSSKCIYLQMITTTTTLDLHQLVF